MEKEKGTSCLVCKHFDIETGYCNAFRGKIPIGIMFGDVGHFKPVDGDHGLQFEPRDDPNAK